MLDSCKGHNFRIEITVYLFLFYTNTKNICDLIMMKLTLFCHHIPHSLASSQQEFGSPNKLVRNFPIFNSEISTHIIFALL